MLILQSFIKSRAFSRRVDGSTVNPCYGEDSIFGFADCFQNPDSRHHRIIWFLIWVSLEHLNLSKSQCSKFNIFHTVTITVVLLNICCFPFSPIIQHHVSLQALFWCSWFLTVVLSNSAVTKSHWNLVVDFDHSRSRGPTNSTNSLIFRRVSDKIGPILPKHRNCRLGGHEGLLGLTDWGSLVDFSARPDWFRWKNGKLQLQFSHDPPGFGLC